MKRIIAYIAVSLTLVIGGIWVAAQVSLEQFEAGTIIEAEAVNANFDALNDAVGSLQTDKQNVITESCVAGSAIRVVNKDGTVECETDDGGSGGGTAGVSSLNGQQGDITLQAGSNVSIDASGPGTIIISASGSGGGGGGGDITAVNAGTGLAGGGDTADVSLSVAPSFQLPQTCANGQVAEWNGSAWVCGADDTGSGGGGGLSAVSSNDTLSGDGTPSDPLGVSVPLALSGAESVGVVRATHDNGNLGYLGGADAGVYGESENSPGVYGVSVSAAGIRGDGFRGVRGETTASGAAAGVFGKTTGTGSATYGVWGAATEPNQVAVFGSNPSGVAGRFEGDVEVTGTLLVTGGPSLPIAYGYVNASASLESGTANVSVSYDASLDRYVISIAGENYFYNNYVTVVTPGGGPAFTRTGSLGGNLLVYIYDTTGAPTQNAFQFVTYKP